MKLKMEFSDSTKESSRRSPFVLGLSGQNYNFSSGYSRAWPLCIIFRNIKKNNATVKKIGRMGPFRWQHASMGKGVSVSEHFCFYRITLYVNSAHVALMMVNHQNPPSKFIFAEIFIFERCLVDISQWSHPFFHGFELPAHATLLITVCIITLTEMIIFCIC